VNTRLKTIVATSLVLVVPAIGLIDLSTGLEYSFSMFYVLPTVAAAWYIGRTFGIGVAILTGLTWGYAESAVRIASLPAGIWNRGTRLLILVALAYLVDLIRRHQEDLRGLLVQRDEFLSLVAHELRAPVSAIEVLAAGLARAPALGADERRTVGQLLELRGRFRQRFPAADRNAQKVCGQRGGRPVARPLGASRWSPPR